MQAMLKSCHPCETEFVTSEHTWSPVSRFLWALQKYFHQVGILLCQLSIIIVISQTNYRVTTYYTHNILGIY